MKKIAILSILGIILVLGFSGCGNGTTNENSEFTVTFDLDGGNIDGVTTSVNITVSSGGIISNIPNPNKDGYDFDGFFTQKNGAGTSFTSSTTVTANIVVYANWTLKVCTCDPKDHLGIGETCCGGIDCECTLKVYGTIIDGLGRVINIYRHGEVADAEMENAVTNIQEGYSSMGYGQKAAFQGKVREIRVLPPIGTAAEDVAAGIIKNEVVDNLVNVSVTHILAANQMLQMLQMLINASTLIE